jgi:hypothetical protein
VATNEGFALLSRMAGRDYDSLPSDTGNVNDEIMLDAVYGGAASPDEPQEYTVYSVDWLDEMPEDVEELADAERVAGEPIEDFTRYLDENFEGWVYHHDRGEVYVLSQQTDESRARQNTRRRD